MPQLLLMGDLLQGLLHAIALLLGFIRALVNQHNLTQVAVHDLQLVLLYCATVLFLVIRALLLASSLILLLIFGGTHFVIVGVPLLSISSLAFLSILSLAHLITFVLE